MGVTSSRPLTSSADYFLYQAAQFIDDLARTLQRLLSNFFSLLFSPFSSTARNHLFGTQTPVCNDTGVCIKPTPRYEEEKEKKRRAAMRMKRAEAAAQGLDPRLLALSGAGLKRTSTNATTTSTSSKQPANIKTQLFEKVELERGKFMERVEVGKEKLVNKVEEEKGKLLKKVEEEREKANVGVGGRWKALLNDLSSMDNLNGKEKEQDKKIKGAEKPLWIMGNIKPATTEESEVGVNVVKHFNPVPSSIAALATANVGLTPPSKESESKNLTASSAGNQLLSKPVAPVRKSSKKIKREAAAPTEQASTTAALQSDQAGQKAKDVKHSPDDQVEKKEVEKKEKSEKTKPAVEVKVTEPSKFFSPPTLKSEPQPQSSSNEIVSKESSHAPNSFVLQRSSSTKQKSQSQHQTQPLQLSTGIGGSTPSHLTHSRKGSAQDSVTFQVIASSSSGSVALNEESGKQKSDGLPSEVIRTRKSSRTRKISSPNVEKVTEENKEGEEGKGMELKKHEKKQVEAHPKPQKGIPASTSQSPVLRRPIAIRVSTSTSDSNTPNSVAKPTPIIPFLVDVEPKTGQRIQLPVELIERDTAPSPSNGIRNSLDSSRGGIGFTAVTPPPRTNGTTSPSASSTRSVPTSPIVMNLLNKAKGAFNDVVSGSNSTSNVVGANGNFSHPARAWSPAISTHSVASSTSSRPSSPMVKNFDNVAVLADKACMNRWESSSKERKKWKDEVNKMALHRCQQGSSSQNLIGSPNTIGIANGISSGNLKSKRRVSANGVVIGRSNSTASNRMGHRRTGSAGTNNVNNMSFPASPPSNKLNLASPASPPQRRSNVPVGIGRVEEGAKINPNTLSGNNPGLQRRMSGKNRERNVART